MRDRGGLFVCFDGPATTTTSHPCYLLPPCHVITSHEPTTAKMDRRGRGQREEGRKWRASRMDMRRAKAITGRDGRQRTMSMYSLSSPRVLNKKLISAASATGRRVAHTLPKLFATPSWGPFPPVASSMTEQHVDYTLSHASHSINNRTMCVVNNMYFIFYML
jgi:hypothetical protein